MYAGTTVSTANKRAVALVTDPRCRAVANSSIPSPLWQGLADPGLWAILANGGLGMLLFATALQRGSVTSATALLFAVATVVPAYIGLAFLGDRTRPGYALVAVLGFVLTIAGTVALAAHDMAKAAVEVGDRSSTG